MRLPTEPVRRLTAATALALVVIAGCGPIEDGGEGPGAGAGSSGRGNHLVLGLQQEPDKLNSILNSMVYGTYINQTIYGFFVKYDEHMELVPEVLTEVPTLANGGISADGLTYTYHLRDDVSWHDGTPFTVADVVFTVEAIMNDQHEVESRIGWDKIERMETPDAHTVIFHLKEPYVPFVSDTFLDEGIMPKHILESHVGTGFTAAPFHRAPIGLGPFKFEEWVTGSHVTVVRNEQYFRGAPSIERITFRFIPDSNSLLVALRAGEIDGYDNASTDHHARIEEMATVDAYVTPLLMWEHLDMNMEDPILADRRVRQAIQLAVDREEISREIYGDLWPPAHGDLSPRLSWYNPAVEELVRFDLTAANALLDETPWKMGDDGYRAQGGERLRLVISTTAGRRQRELTEQVLQQHLRKVGIELAIQNHNATSVFAPFEQDGVLKRGRYQLFMYAWIGSPDPDKFTLYHSTQIPPPAGQNHPRLNNPRVDELIEGGLLAIDPAERKKIHDELQVLLATEVPMTPLVWRADVDAMTTRLQGYKPNPTQCGDTWNVWEWVLQ